MKKETEKEREIYAIGSPSFETLTPNEKKHSLVHSCLVLLNISSLKKNIIP